MRRTLTTHIWHAWANRLAIFGNHENPLRVPLFFVAYFAEG